MSLLALSWERRQHADSQALTRFLGTLFQREACEKDLGSILLPTEAAYCSNKYLHMIYRASFGELSYYQLGLEVSHEEANWLMLVWMMLRA